MMRLYVFLPLLLVAIDLLGLASGTPTKQLRRRALDQDQGVRRLPGCSTPSQRRRNPNCKPGDDQEVAPPTTTVTAAVSDSDSDSLSVSNSISRSRSSRSQQANYGTPKRKRGPSEEFDYQQHDAIDFTNKRDAKRFGRKRGFGADNHKLNPRKDDSIVHLQDPSYKPKPSGPLTKLRAAKDRRDDAARKRKQKQQREENRQRDSYDWDNDSDESNDQMYQRYHKNSKEKSLSVSYDDPDAGLTRAQLQAKRDKEEREERKAQIAAHFIKQELPILVQDSVSDVFHTPQMKHQLSESINDMKETLAMMKRLKDRGESDSLDGLYKNNPDVDWENDPSVDYAWKPMSNNELFGASEDMLRDFTNQAPDQGTSGLGNKLNNDGTFDDTGNYKLNEDEPADAAKEKAKTKAVNTGDAGDESPDSVDMEAEMKMYQQQGQDAGDASPDSVDMEAEMKMYQQQNAQAQDQDAGPDSDEAVMLKALQGQDQDQDAGDQSPDSIDMEAEMEMYQQQNAQNQENTGQVAGSTGV